NLSLKEYLGGLFPGASDISPHDLEPDFPVVSRGLLPISGDTPLPRTRRDDPNATPVAPLLRTDAPPPEAALPAELAAAPAESLDSPVPPGTLAPVPARSRRLKARTRPR